MHFIGGQRLVIKDKLNKTNPIPVLIKMFRVSAGCEKDSLPIS